MKMNQPAREWKTRHEGVEYGPYTDAEMATYIDQLRISEQTEVHHHRLTQGLWLKALAVKPLRDRIGRSQAPPVQAPPQAAPPSAMIAIAQAMRADSRSRSRPQPMRGSRPALTARVVLISATWMMWMFIQSVGFLYHFYSFDYRADGFFGAYAFRGSLLSLHEWLLNALFMSAILPGIFATPLAGIATFVLYFLLAPRRSP